MTKWEILVWLGVGGVSGCLKLHLPPQLHAIKGWVLEAGFSLFLPTELQRYLPDTEVPEMGSSPEEASPILSYGARADLGSSPSCP